MLCSALLQFVLLSTLLVKIWKKNARRGCEADVRTAPKRFRRFNIGYVTAKNEKCSGHPAKFDNQSRGSRTRINGWSNCKRARFILVNSAPSSEGNRGSIGAWKMGISETVGSSCKYLTHILLCHYKQISAIRNSRRRRKILEEHCGAQIICKKKMSPNRLCQVIGQINVK